MLSIKSRGLAKFYSTENGEACQTSSSKDPYKRTNIKTKTYQKHLGAVYERRQAVDTYVSSVGAGSVVLTKRRYETMMKRAENTQKSEVQEECHAPVTQ